MTFHTDEAKQIRGKKVFMLAQNVDPKRKFDIKAKKNWLKKFYFLGSPYFRQLCQNRLYSFPNNMFLLT